MFISPRSFDHVQLPATALLSKLCRVHARSTADGLKAEYSFTGPAMRCQASMAMLSLKRAAFLLSCFLDCQGLVGLIWIEPFEFGDGHIAELPAFRTCN